MLLEGDVMSWVRFLSDFDCHNGPRTTAYKAGWEGRILSRCADLAVSTGKAEWIEVPNRLRFLATAEDEAHGN